MTNMIVRVGTFLCLLTLLSLIGRAWPVQSATTSVACDVPTLISAITNASSGDTLDLASVCTYTLTSKIVNVGLPDILSTLTINGHGSTITRASGGIQNVQLNGQTGNTYCHLIASGVSFLTSPAEIGVPSVLDLGVVEAVNIFGSLPNGAPGMIFSAPVTVCLRGSGDVLFLSASDLSRTPQHLAATSNGGFECVSVQNPGRSCWSAAPRIPQSSPPIHLRA